MELAAASQFIGLSPYPGLRVRLLALRLTWPAGFGRGQIALHGLRLGRAGSLSRGAATCGSPRLAQVHWGSLRVVTTGWGRAVTTRLPQGLA